MHCSTPGSGTSNSRTVLFPRDSMRQPLPSTAIPSWVIGRSADVNARSRWGGPAGSGCLNRDLNQSSMAPSLLRLPGLELLAEDLFVELAHGGLGDGVHEDHLVGEPPLSDLGAQELQDLFLRELARPLRP